MPERPTRNVDAAAAVAAARGRNSTPDGPKQGFRRLGDQAPDGAGAANTGFNVLGEGKGTRQITDHGRALELGGALRERAAAFGVPLPPEMALRAGEILLKKENAAGGENPEPEGNAK